MHKETADSMNTCCRPSSDGFVVSSSNQDSEQCARSSVVAGSDVFSTPIVVNSIEAGFASLETTRLSPFENLNVHTSESCHRNFVIFDTTQNKNTVILHPSWLTSWSKDATPENAKPFISNLESFSDKVLKAMHDFHSSESEMPKFGKTFEFTKQKTGTRGIPTHGAGIVESDYIPQFKDVCSFDFLQKSVEGDLSSEFHEDTEEIDALLSSDDELSSTGHSPSCGFSNCNSNENAQNKSILGKRKNSSKEEDDDADSGPAKIEPETVEGHFGFVLPDSKYSVSTLYTETQSPRQYAVDVDGVYGHSSENLGSCCDVLESKKKLKLRMSIQQLKDAVLCHEGLDTAEVLSRTIQHVKNLQDRLLDLDKGTEPNMVKRMKMDALLWKRCG